MRRNPNIGTVGELKFAVEAKHAIDFDDEHMPAVLCTPWLIWFLEHAAREAVLPSLDDGESTVGTFVEVRHLAATPPGRIVTCAARIVRVDDPMISFQLEARDEHEVIARGYHKLRVINVARFAQRVRDKSEGK
jgi:fluoroacetyl-CoA thioesterase